jgi:hypothetical protein
MSLVKLLDFNFDVELRVSMLGVFECALAAQSQFGCRPSTICGYAAQATPNVSKVPEKALAPSTSSRDRCSLLPQGVSWVACPRARTVEGAS